MSSPEGRESEPWVPIAFAPGGDPGRTLQPIYDVLQAAEIPAGFDPYRPGDASSPYPQPYRAFKVVVPASLRDRALEVVREAGIAIPGERMSDAVSREEPAPSQGWSDEVLDEDVEVARAARRRRLLLAGVGLLLLLAVVCAYVPWIRTF